MAKAMWPSQQCFALAEFAEQHADAKSSSHINEGITSGDRLTLTLGSSGDPNICGHLSV